MTFIVERTAGKLGDIVAGHDTKEIRNVEYVDISKLTEYGFSEKFQDLAVNSFPGRGQYMGEKRNIGL